jgi:hypothetical protein
MIPDHVQVHLYFHCGARVSQSALFCGLPLHFSLLQSNGSGLTWKHSGIMHITPIDQKAFTPRPVAYKSTDLAYTNCCRKATKSGEKPLGGLQHHQ